MFVHSRVRVMAWLALAPALGVAVRGSDPVPAPYQSTYTYLQGQISSFRASVQQHATAGISNVIFSADLQGANSNLGSAFLLNSTTLPGILREAAYLQAMGVKAVHVAVSFPVLTPSYYGDATTAQQMIAFYGQVAAQIHAMGLTLIVETGPVNLDSSSGPTVGANSYLAGLSTADYINGRAQTAVTIAQTMQPDYLTVLNEPDTEALISQKPIIGTMGGSAAMLGTILQALHAAGAQTQVGAGVGSWLPNSSAWVTQIANTPGVNYVDIHVFPIYNSFLSNLFTFAQIAQTAGKPLAMSQAWLYKVAPNDSSGYSAVHARDAFSFWQPLDAQFIQSLVSFSRSNNTVFFSPFWSRYFRAYLNYAQYGNLTGADLESQVAATTTAAGAAGQIDATGQAYAQAIISPADTVPPTIPSGLSGAGANSSSVALTWNASVDNVGVLGYKVYRDGTLVATVASPFYVDTGASPAYHAYSVESYDASGNTSGQSAGTRSAPLDTVAPMAPAWLSAAAASPVQVNLNWTGATDNLAVTQYQVYRGLSPAALSVIAAGITSTNWIDTQVIPGTTFYYAVKALDAVHNSSGFSPVAAVKLPADTTPPTVPTGLIVQSSSTTSNYLSWSSSTDNWKVGGYRIYRGTSPSALRLIGSTSDATAFTDTAAASKTTYYYAVAAYDVFLNVSAPSAPVAVVTK